MHITVQGAHRVRVRPDLADLRLTALAESGTRERAIAEATRTANALADSLAALSGVVRHTVDPIRVSSWYPTDQNGRRLAERVSAQVGLGATFTDFEQLADFTARAGSLAGVQLGGVAWSVTPETRDRLEAEVLAEAIDRARRRALAMAHADGGGEVEILDISDPGLLGGGGDAPVAREAMFRAKGMADVGGVDVVPEDVEVAEVVHVRFRVVEKQAPLRRGRD